MSILTKGSVALNVYVFAMIPVLNVRSQLSRKLLEPQLFVVKTEFHRITVQSCSREYIIGSYNKSIEQTQSSFVAVETL
jgi:hypothetical protein